MTRLPTAASLLLLCATCLAAAAPGLAGPASGHAARSTHGKRTRPPPLRVEDDPRIPGDSERFAKVRVAFVEPRDGQEVPAQEAAEGVRVTLEVSGYALGPVASAPPGTHCPRVLLLVDQGSPFTLADQGPTVLTGLDPGPHLLRALLVRPWPEVVKAEGAFALTRFWVGPRPGAVQEAREAEARVWPDPGKPLLTLALPFALPDPLLRLAPAQLLTQVPAPSPLVLDFFISGARLRADGRGHKVRLVIDKREHPLLRAWKPVPLSLAEGTHRLTIDLLDARGTKVKNVLNRTDRTFEVLAPSIEPP